MVIDIILPAMLGPRTAVSEMYERRRGIMRAILTGSDLDIEHRNLVVETLLEVASQQE